MGCSGASAELFYSIKTERPRVVDAGTNLYCGRCGAGLSSAVGNSVEQDGLGGEEGVMGALPGVDHAVGLGHLVARDRADRQGHDLGDRLVVALLDAREGDHQTATQDGAAAPERVALAVGVGLGHLDDRAGEPGAPGDERLAARDLGVLRVLFAADEGDEDDGAVEHLVEVLVLGAVDDAGVDHDDRAGELVEFTSLDHRGDVRLGSHPGALANFFRESGEQRHGAPYMTQLC